MATNRHEDESLSQEQGHPLEQSMEQSIHRICPPLAVAFWSGLLAQRGWRRFQCSDPVQRSSTLPYPPSNLAGTHQCSHTPWSATPTSLCLPYSSTLC